MAADIALIARRAAEGIIEATKEVGGNVEDAAKVTVEAAIEAAGSIGKTAAREVEEILVGVVKGLKEIATSALPQSGAHKDQ